MASRGGRPTKYSDRVRKKICAGLAKGLPMSAALAAAGVSTSAHSVWMSKHPEYRAAVEDALEEGEGALVSKLLDDPASIRWLLTRRKPEAYSDPQKPTREQLAEKHDAEVERIKAQTEAIKDGRGSDGLAELAAVLGQVGRSRGADDSDDGE